MVHPSDRPLLGAPLSSGQILQVLRQGSVSRSELARRTGLSATTISARLNPLLDLGYLHQSTASRNQGRRPISVAINPNYGLVVTVHIGTHHTRIGILDASGALLGAHQFDATTAIEADRYLSWLKDEIKIVLLDERTTPKGIPLRAIGVSIAAPVDAKTGRLVDPSHMPGWDGVEPVNFLRDGFGVPVFVDNDATLMALGEHLMHYPNVENMLYVKIGSAVGCGVISSGKIHRGRHGGAGEIGHLPVDTEYRRTCVCSRNNCLEACLGGAALVAHLREVGIHVASTSDLLDPGLSGQPEVRDLLQASGRAVGESLGLLTDFFNPELIVLGGNLARSDVLNQALRVALYSRSLPLSTRMLTIAPSTNGANASILGAGHMVLNHLLDAASIDQALADNAA